MAGKDKNSVDGLTLAEHVTMLEIALDGLLVQLEDPSLLPWTSLMLVSQDWTQT